MSISAYFINVRINKPPSTGAQLASGRRVPTAMVGPLPRPTPIPMPILMRMLMKVKVYSEFPKKKQKEKKNSNKMMRPAKK